MISISGGFRRKVVLYFSISLYSTLLLRSSFSENGLSAPVNKLKERNIIQSITLSSNLLTMPPSLPKLLKNVGQNSQKYL
ncbi:hypothetical protein LEP1GSC161_0297 [Leptospira santarosai str. CBC1416]|uniref:Uncharacterized protein n=1 Tax=Leptospira santarosai str. CBC1416 TaxID=1193059 RepID=M6W4J4_9LEPT|nr:hypothetical protein LEP1GSC161_0297 [Leptospira santarosai str. CBC1416]